ncbi:hypothetical protein B0H11DRAFT_613031 [Mycena galericulata]|nr:hypothetical protein B0H11DRAFT_613031 [Mycena galericulata]
MAGWVSSIEPVETIQMMCLWSFVLALFHSRRNLFSLPVLSPVLVIPNEYLFQRRLQMQFHPDPALERLNMHSQRGASITAKNSPILWRVKVCGKLQMQGNILSIEKKSLSHPPTMGQKRKRAEWFVELIMAARRTSKPRPGTEVDAPRSASEEDAASDTDSDTHSDVSVEIDASAPYWDYLVKWAKYPDKDNSWEPARNLLACEQLILSFWKNVGENLFLTDGQGFEVRASPHWIREQKQNFWHQNSLDEVLEQKRNPKRKRSETLSAPRTPISSPRSTPRRPQSSPRKVTFAPVVDVSVVPSIRDVENTAEWYRTTRRKTYDSSDSEDDTPTGGSTTLSGLKIRIPRRSLPESPVDASYGSPGPTTPDPFSEPPLSSPIVDSNVIRGSPDPATPDLSSEMPPSSPTVHAEPPPSPPPTPPRPARVPWPRVKYIEKRITDRPKLKTKYRLSMAPVAPNIPRASPALVDDTMDVDGDTGPMLLPDSTTAAVPDATDDLGPMLTFVSLEDGEGGNDGAGTGFYASDEDRYPGIRKNGDSMDWTEGVSQLDNCDAGSGVFGANEGDSSPIAIGDVDVDNFLNTQVLPIMK